MGKVIMSIVSGHVFFYLQSILLVVYCAFTFCYNCYRDQYVFYYAYVSTMVVLKVMASGHVTSTAIHGNSTLAALPEEHSFTHLSHAMRVMSPII